MLGTPHSQPSKLPVFLIVTQNPRDASPSVFDFFRHAEDAFRFARTITPSLDSAASRLSHRWITASEARRASTLHRNMGARYRATRCCADRSVTALHMCRSRHERERWRTHGSRVTTVGRGAVASAREFVDSIAVNRQSTLAHDFDERRLTIAAAVAIGKRWPGRRRFAAETIGRSDD